MQPSRRRSAPCAPAGRPRRVDEGILDTNLLASALISPGGLPDTLYRAWRERRYTLLASDAQLEEFRRLTRYPALRRFIEPAAAGTMYNALGKLAVVLTDLSTVDASRDPADNFLLATARAGAADYLATGDNAICWQ